MITVRDLINDCSASSWLELRVYRLGSTILFQAELVPSTAETSNHLVKSFYFRR